MPYATYHNHTTFCDGQSTAEEMTQAAVAAGCSALGFSGHSYTFFDETYCMSRVNTARYRQEISRLKAQYAGQLRILCGVEQDYWSNAPTDGYDFVIGSSHYVRKNGHYLPVDNSKEELLRGVNAQYGGDVLSFCEDYYRQMADMQRKTNCTFIGHFDLVTKFNEGGALFSEADPRYRAAALAALDALCAQNTVFEINTGAMAKGYRTTPYPARFLLERIRDNGRPVILNADCHDASKLLYGLDQAKQLAQSVRLTLLTEL